MRFRISQSRDGQFYFEIQTLGRFETIATSERYTTKAALQRNIDYIRQGAESATVDDQSGS